MASRAINIYSPLTRPRVRGPSFDQHAKTARFSRWTVACSAAAQESSSSSPTATVTDRKESGTAAAAEVVAPAAAPPRKAKPKKAPVKALPDLMEEDVIPSLKATLEAEEDLSQIELSFQENRLEGSFLKNDIPYAFWAFFPDGTLNGTKGFSLSSYGSEASTVEPFLIDEKKITARLVVFWIEKRLAAQGIIPVWKEE